MPITLDGTIGATMPTILNNACNIYNFYPGLIINIA